MSIAPTEQQQEVIDSKADVTFVSCSAGCGASITAVLTALNSGNGSVVITSHSKHVEYNPENYIPEIKNIEVMHGVDIFEHDFGEKHVIIDGAQVFDPDFLSKISAKKIIIFSYPTSDISHSCYQFARNMDKKFVSLYEGAPFFCDNKESLIDIFGNALSFASFRMSYLNNKHLTDACPQYVENLNSLPNRDRKRLKGYWDFESPLNY